ncbi:hypothetical protein ES705_47188 [subsurface metagenome]
MLPMDRANNIKLNMTNSIVTTLGLNVVYVWPYLVVETVNASLKKVNNQIPIHPEKANSRTKNSCLTVLNLSGIEALPITEIREVIPNITNNN